MIRELQEIKALLKEQNTLLSRMPRSPMSRMPRHDLSCSKRLPIRAAYTLVELLIVVAIVGIFAGLVLTRFESSYYDQLRGRPRSSQPIWPTLAVSPSLTTANTSSPLIQLPNVIGCNTVARIPPNLPPSPYRDPTDPATKQTTNLGKLPGLNAALELVAVRNVSSTSEVDTTTPRVWTAGLIDTNGILQDLAGDRSRGWSSLHTDRTRCHYWFDQDW